MHQTEAIREPGSSVAMHILGPWLKRICREIRSQACNLITCEEKGLGKDEKAGKMRSRKQRE